MKTNIRKSQSSTTISDIPDGFTTRTRPDSQHYLVPSYMVPALDQAFVSYRTKAELGVCNQPAGVSEVLNYKWEIEGGRPVGTGQAIGTVLFIVTNSNLIKSDIPLSYQLFQSTQTIGKGFVEIGEELLFFPADPVSHHLQLVYRTT